MKRSPIPRLVMLASVLSLCSCVGPSPVDLEADRAFYTAVAGEYVRYVQADTTLDAQQKELRLRTIEVHGMLLNRREAEANR